MNDRPVRAIALGFFDGVHRGHALILHKTVEAAHELGLRPAALTFRQHPRALTGGGAPPLLTTAERRAALIAGQGIEEVLMLDFDRSFASQTPEKFIFDVLHREYRCGAVVTGENYRFGCGAQGTPALLHQEGEALGMRVITCPAVTDGGKPISSTRIRRLVEAGELENAGRLLGRPFSLAGQVVHGRRVGRRLGFPTINLAPEPELALPPHGVYAARVHIAGQTVPAVTNIGVRPTFGESGSLSVESYLMDFDRQVYEQTAQVDLLRFLRPEQAFPSADALREQIARDVQSALRAQHEVKL